MANTKCRTQCFAIQCLIQTRSLIAPHNEQSVPGDVLFALVDRLGSLAETKVAMTPHCTALLPNGAPHSSPSEGCHCCQGWPDPGSGKDIQARKHCSGPALCPTTQESMSFPKPQGDVRICSGNRTNRRGLDKQTKCIHKVSDRLGYTEPQCTYCNYSWPALRCEQD